jgi:hypothetical protein
MKARPYLVVNFIEQPREKVNTSKAGWMNNPDNIKTIELVSVVDRLNTKHIRSPVIIDLVEGKTVSNNTNKPSDEVVEHYITRYSDMIQEGLKKWAMREMSR